MNLSNSTRRTCLTAGAAHVIKLGFVPPRFGAGVRRVWQIAGCSFGEPELRFRPFLNWQPVRNPVSHSLSALSREIQGGMVCWNRTKLRPVQGRTSRNFETGCNFGRAACTLWRTTDA